MNVIVANTYTELLTSLNIDVIKSINGEYEVEDIISAFKNFFFNRMILDITAIKDYKDFSKIQKLSMNLDMNKVILILDDSHETSTPTFLSKLISIGIYNFTKTIDNIPFLMDNPNTYKDVAEYHHINNPEITEVPVEQNKPVVIGFKNLTDNAGATTLVYLLKRLLVSNYRVMALELNRNDFVYFNDEELISINSTELGNSLAKYSNMEVVLIDMNDFVDESLCDQVVHLIEPSGIKLNKMMATKPGLFKQLPKLKLVLNKSILTKKDISDFEFESKGKVFFNIPPLDDKEANQKILNPFLIALGFSRQQSEGEPNFGETNILRGIFKPKN